VGLALVVSLVVLAGAWGVSSWAQRKSLGNQALGSVVSLPIAQLREDCASVGQALGPGSFRQEVRIRGNVVCEAPLLSQYSKTLCVSYGFSVTREYEEVLWSRELRGPGLRMVRRRSETVAGNEVSRPFELDDGTGRILVEPDRATVERTKTYSLFEPWKGAGADGTLGYRYEEHCLAVGEEVIVIGEAGDAGGQLALRAPEHSRVPFVIGRGVSDLGQRDQRTVPVLQGVSIGLAAVAVIIFLLGVIH